MPPTLRQTLPTICCVTFFTLALDLAGAILPAEKLLPDDTLVVVSTPDFALLREFYKASPQTRLLNDPAMKPFVDKFVTKLREEIAEPLEHDLGVKFDDYAALPQGQMTFAITQNGWQGGASPVPAALFLLDTKGKSSQLKTNLAELRRKWVDAGKTLKTEKIRDQEFAAFLLSDKDVPPSLKKALAAGGEDSSGDTATNSPPTELLIGQVESLLIAGTSVKAVEKVIAHLTGGSAPSLADVPAFEANRLAIFRDAPFYGWANAKTFLEVFNKKTAKGDADSADPLALFSPDKVLTATGLAGVKTLAFAAQNSAEGSLIQFVITAPEAGRQGLLQLLPADGKESSPPPFVPADAVKFQRCRLDGQRAWATIQKMLNDISPQIMSGVNFALDTANTAAKLKDPAFDLQKNLFGNLGDDVIFYSKSSHESAPALVLIGSPRPEQLADALKNLLVLLSAQGGAPAEREFLGRKIYSVPLPMLAFDTGTGGSTSPTLYYAASGSYLAVSTDTAMLEEYLRHSDGQQKALRESAGLMDAIQKVGGTSVGLFGYENNAETARALFESLRKAAQTNSNSLTVGMTLDFNSYVQMKDWADYSLLPPFEQIAKYFYFNVYGVSANTDGLTYKVFTPVPPQLKN